MKHILSILLPVFFCCCTQNQLILDPFDEGESLMIEDEEAIAQFEQMMENVPRPENEYKASNSSDNSVFDSLDVLSSYQLTQPIMGVCRSGEKEYYYHIERDSNDTLISDLDLGVTDYVISPEKYKEITDFIRIHTPVPAEYSPETADSEENKNEEKDKQET